jgi:crotonobetainyl-CoA:carnitine CoA-transferase CaiB-like acyl-CoA transferase
VVDTSLMEAAVQQTYWQAAIYFATGQSPQALGSAHALTAPYQAFHAADGWLNIGGANQANWERLTDVLGHPEWKSDPRFRANSDRMRNRAALTEEINAVLCKRTRADWMQAFDAAGVPAGPVHSIAEAIEHPQTRARGMVIELEHPQAGVTRALGNPLHFSATPGGSTLPAPLLGQHTREVLRECGYSDAEIDAFAADGVIVTGP